MMKFSESRNSRQFFLFPRRRTVTHVNEARK